MKIVMAQLDFKVGALNANAARIIDTIKDYSHREDIDFLVFSETAITGYPPLDLVQIPGFIDQQLICLDIIRKATEHVNFHVVLGCITKNITGPGKSLHNTLVVFKKGQYVLEYNKVLLPTYNIFDERRYFEPGFGNNTIEYKGRTIAFLICEDAWANKSDDLYRKNPIEDTFDGGLNEVDLLITINASPSNIGKRNQRMDVYQDISKTYKVPLIYVNQVGGNDGIVFDGGSFALNSEGSLVGLAKSFEESLVEVDFSSAEPLGCGYFIPTDRFTYEQIKLGLREYVEKIGFKGVVIGESGGIDSAVVTALAVDALGADRVKAITMPSYVSSEGSVTDSEILCKNLGVELFNIPIKDQYSQFMKCFNELGNTMTSTDNNKVTEQNTQSRIRGQILMGFSNRFGYLVLNTGNKSELSVGYFTLGGDSMGGIAPIGDLFKMQVYALGNYYNHLHGSELIPKAILDKEPSAELEVGQVDSRDLPIYPVLDAILKLYVEHLEMTPEEYYECRQIIKHNSTTEEVNKVLRKVTFNEHKRAVVPKCIRVNSVAYGSGWQMPIAQGYVPTTNAITIKE